MMQHYVSDSAHLWPEHSCSIVNWSLTERILTVMLRNLTDYSANKRFTALLLFPSNNQEEGKQQQWMIFNISLMCVFQGGPQQQQQQQQQQHWMIFNISLMCVLQGGPQQAGPKVISMLWSVSTDYKTFTTTLPPPPTLLSMTLWPHNC